MIKVLGDLAWCYELLLKRLAAYEDTGLEPSEINELIGNIEKILRFPRFVEAMMRSDDKALEDY